MGFAFSLFAESAGGILYIWDAAWFTEVFRVCHPKFVAIKGSWIAGVGPIGLICIYAPNNHTERVGFFEFPISFVNAWGCYNFIIFGDFNSVFSREEKLGVYGFGDAYEELCSFVDALVLYDLSLLGSGFTYFGSSQSVARSRIDRFFILDGAKAWFSNVRQKAIFHFFSDHTLIIVSSGDSSASYCPFRFFNVWCQDQELGNLVANM